MELLKNEKEIMNMYVTDHPVKPYMPQITDKTKYNISQLADVNWTIPSGVYGGMISDISVMRTKRNKLMSKFQFEDTTGSIEVICFKHEKFKEKITEDRIVFIKGKFEPGDRGNQIIMYDIEDIILDENFKPKETITVKKEEVKPFEIYITEQVISEEKINMMNRAMQSNFGSEEVFLHINKNDGKNIRAQMPFKVNSQDGNLRSQLNSIFDNCVNFS